MIKKVIRAEDENAKYSIDSLNREVGSAYIHCETEVCYDTMFYGFIDAWAVVKGKLHIFDLKTGWASTDADHLAQQEGYALALLNMAKKGMWPEITDTDNAILHLIWEDQRRTYSWDTTYNLAKCLVMEILAKRMSPDSKPAANKNCQYCERLNSCEAVNHELMEVVKLITCEDLPTRFKSPEELSRGLMVKDIVLAWCGGMQKLGVAHVKAGGELPGWTSSLVKGREQAPDLKDAWEAVKPSLEAKHGKGGAKDEFLKCCKVVAGKLRGLDYEEDFPAEHVMKRGEPYYRLICKKRLIK
jgi:hypothetical protein